MRARYWTYGTAMPYQGLCWMKSSSSGKEAQGNRESGSVTGVATAAPALTVTAAPALSVPATSAPITMATAAAPLPIASYPMQCSEPETCDAAPPGVASAAVGRLGACPSLGICGPPAQVADAASIGWQVPEGD